MGLSRRQFTKEFKLAAVRRLEQGVSIGEAARALEVNPNVLHRWRREFRQGPGNVFPGNGKQRWSEGRIAELERKVGQQTLEIDFLKGCLQRIEEQVAAVEIGCAQEDVRKYGLQMDDNSDFGFLDVKSFEWHVRRNSTGTAVHVMEQGRTTILREDGS